VLRQAVASDTIMHTALSPELKGHLPVRRGGLPRRSCLELHTALHPQGKAEAQHEASWHASETWIANRTASAHAGASSSPGAHRSTLVLVVCEISFGRKFTALAKGREVTTIPLPCR
jgi:hypothetical protein